MRLTVRYFALLREAIGVGREELDVEGITTVEDLEAYLKRDAVHDQAFNQVRRIRVAVNSEMCARSAALKDGDEVAFFPPVTGG